MSVDSFINMLLPKSVVSWEQKFKKFLKKYVKGFSKQKDCFSCSGGVIPEIQTHL